MNVPSPKQDMINKHPLCVSFRGARPYATARSLSPGPQVGEVTAAATDCWVFRSQELHRLTPYPDVSLFLADVLARNSLIPVQKVLRSWKRCTEVTSALHSERLGQKRQANVNKKGFVGLMVMISGNSVCQRSTAVKNPPRCTMGLSNPGSHGRVKNKEAGMENGDVLMHRLRFWEASLPCFYRQWRAAPPGAWSFSTAKVMTGSQQGGLTGSQKFEAVVGRKEILKWSFR